MNVMDVELIYSGIILAVTIGFILYYFLELLIVTLNRLASALLLCRDLQSLKTAVSASGLDWEQFKSAENLQNARDRWARHREDL